MECVTKRRGFFRGFTAAEKPGTLGSLAACARPWGSNPSRKNEIECCVDRLRPPPKAEIRTPKVDHFSLFPARSFLNRSTDSAMAWSGDFVIIMFTGITTSQSIGSISPHVSSAIPLPNTL